MWHSQQCSLEYQLRQKKCQLVSASVEVGSVCDFVWDRLSMQTWMVVLGFIIIIILTS